VITKKGLFDMTKTLFLAKHTFKAEEDQDLALEKGQLVYGNYLEDAWWVGENPVTGKEGVFPANFVVEYNSADADKVLRKLEKKDPENPQVLAYRAAEANEFQFLQYETLRKLEKTDPENPQVLEYRAVGASGYTGTAPTTTKTLKKDESTNGNDVDDVKVDIMLDDKDDDGGVPPGMHSDGDEGDNDDVETKDSEMTSGQAAAIVAQTLATSTAPALPKSIWHSWKMKTVLAATKCFLSLISFSCLAGGQFHNIDFINKLTDKPLAGEASDALWYIVTAVQFSIAWCILMWMFEFAMTVAFFLRGRGELPDVVQNITDNQPLLFLVYDCLNLFMLSVAGFNMGAAASLPKNVVKLLIQTDFEELVHPVALNCSDTSKFVANSTMVTCPNPFEEVTSGTGNNVEHLNICKCGWVGGGD
jgi:hypothetical protein